MPCCERCKARIAPLWALFVRWLKPDGRVAPFPAFVLSCLFLVVVSGAIIFMMLCPSPTDGKMGWGALRFDGPGGTTYETWMEVNSQILNGLFTLAALINQPSRCTQLFLLFTHPAALGLGVGARVGAKIVQRHGQEQGQGQGDGVLFPAPHLNRAQRLRVLLLLNLNCIAQYPITAVHWCFRPEGLGGRRPPLVLALCLPLSFGAAIAAGVLEARYKGQHDKLEQQQRQEDGGDSAKTAQALEAQSFAVAITENDSKSNAAKNCR